MPFGETFFEKRSHWATRYKFNAKEKDEETGLYYYGARYYTPDLSVWLSVDMMSDKYPNLSPFAYCANNPVILIDPDGMAAIKPPSAADYVQSNISEQGQQRFDAILQNIGSLVGNNENAMQALMNTTGLKREDILKDLAYNQGPQIELAPGGAAFAGSGEIFSFGSDIIKNLTNENIDINTQAFGAAMVILDEYSHIGDKRTNNGISTGDPSLNQPEGTQTFKKSPTSHRGSDLPLFGFGVDIESLTKPNSGVINVKKTGPEMIKYPQAGYGKIPENIDIKSLGRELLKNSTE